MTCLSLMSEISYVRVRVNRAKVIAFFVRVRVRVRVRVNRAKLIAFFDYSGFVECLKLSG